jgi:hypothetical protein
MAYVDPTTNYNWNLPDEGGDSGAWGGLLNEIFGNETTGIDAKLKAVSDVADGAVQKDGTDSTMTGVLTTLIVREKVEAIAASEIDWNEGNYFTKTISGNTTFTFANLPATLGDAQFITVRVINSGLYSVSWPATVNWHNGTTPTQTASGTDVYVLVCEGDPTTPTIYGARCLEDAS